MPASCYLITMVDNCVPQRQLSSCSVTRPFLSLRRVWLARLHDLLIALYVNLNEAVAQLVRITQGYTFISSVSYVCLRPSVVCSSLSHSSRWCIHKAYQADVILPFKTRTRSQGEILCQSQLQSSLSLPKK